MVSPAAGKVKESFLAAFYHRLAARRGRTKARIAGAHQRLVRVDPLRTPGALEHARGAAALDARQPDRLLQRIQRRIAHLGETVRLEPIAAATT